MTETYNWEQKVFSIAWLSTRLGMELTFGNQEDLQQIFTNRTTAVFDDAQMQELIGKWELVWGTAVYQAAGSWVSDHTMFVAKYITSSQSESEQYIISIAGTNPLSLYNWLVVDSDVGKVKDWNGGEPWRGDYLNPDAQKPGIARGMAVGTKTLITQMRSNDGILLLEYLKQLTANTTKPITITVAGHSMAGGLSPCLGLLLLDRQSEWNLANKATVKVFTFGGPSPGNMSFAKYYNNKFGENSQRGWNNNDLVPLAWESETLQKGPSIFVPYIQPNFLIESIVTLMKFLTRGHIYEHLNKPESGFSGPQFWDLPSKGVAKLNPKMIDAENLDVLVDSVSKLLLSSISIFGQSEDENPGGEQNRTFFDEHNINSVYQSVQSLPKVLKKIIQKMTKEIFEFQSPNLNLLNPSLEFPSTIVPKVGPDFLNSEIVDELRSVLEDISFELRSFQDTESQGRSTDIDVFFVKNVVDFIFFIVLKVFQHLWGYVINYDILPFDEKLPEIWAEMGQDVGGVVGGVVERTQVWEYSKKVDSDDIKDLKAREGKAWESIAKEIEDAVSSGEIDKEAQPIVLIVKKKKEGDSLFPCFS